MEQRVSLITLGVADVAAARDFYAALGWEGHEVEETVFFQAGGLGVVLWGREKLVADGRRSMRRSRPQRQPGRPSPAATAVLADW